MFKPPKLKSTKATYRDVVGAARDFNKTWRRPGFRLMSAEALVEDFETRGMTKSKAEAIANMPHEAPHQIHAVLERVSDVIGGHGTGSIMSSSAYSAGWGQAIAVYAVAGDEDEPTVLYDVARDKLLMASYGEWADRNNKRLR